MSCIVLSGDVTMFLALVELLSLVLFRAPALSLCKRMAVPFAVDVIIGRSSSVCLCIGRCITERSPLSTTQVIFLCSVRCEVAFGEGLSRKQEEVPSKFVHLCFNFFFVFYAF